VLLYVTNCSLDGYTEDPDGDFNWSEPDDELHQFFNDLLRPIGTQLLGRRMYETMAVWETDPSLAADSIGADFAAVWQDSEKVVYSRTLEAPITKRTRIERDFDLAAVERLKASSATDLSISGPELAGQGIRAGLVDEIELVVFPVVVGGGKPALPAGVRLDLELLDQHTFAASGIVRLRYRVRR
jgi:dihydrofolate reductase